jgi:hypothetical protein
MKYGILTHWFGGEDSSSSDDKDLEDYANVDQYEKSLRFFEEGSDDEIDEYELLQNGIDLSDSFIDRYKKPSRTGSIRWNDNSSKTQTNTG